MRRYPDPTCPIGDVVWHEAAAYCNWLSKKEDIPEDQWCYEMDQQGRVVKLKENYLSLPSYRLPQEAEWEYACRAGAVTSRYFGEAEDLLASYGWYLKNSQPWTSPVGSKKPNDFGLFDLYGPVSSWCQNRYEVYPRGQGGKAIDDKEDTLIVNAQDARVLRGGSFHSQPSFARSARRNHYGPSIRYYWVGFRPLRTFPP
jgi:formylglycine-generating enzyme required for sulfatase activity